MNRTDGKQINKNPTTLVRIDSELHRLLKIKAAQEKGTLKRLLEDVLSELLSPIKNEDQ